MAFNFEKLRTIAKPRSEESLKKEEYWSANEGWLERSKEIALAIHYYLRTKNLTQTALADKMGVSAPYVAKIMKGNENLTLETICKLEKFIGEPLINILKPYQSQRILFRFTKTDFENSDAENSPKISCDTNSQGWCKSFTAVA